jgi:hypothetical protein
MHFLRIAGVNRGLTIRKQDLDKDTAGLAYSGHTIPSVIGRAIDHDHVRAEYIMLLDGGEAEMHMRGDKWTGATSDYRKVDGLLHRAVFDAEREAMIRAIPAEELQSRSPADLVAEYGTPIMDRWQALLDPKQANTDGFDAHEKKAKAIVSLRAPFPFAPNA